MLKITSLNHSAKGICKLENKVVFVEGAIPGDEIEIEIIKDKKKYIEAKIKKFIKKSDLRIESGCPYFDVCGGCDLLMLNYENQLKFKYEKISNIMEKYLKENVSINEIIKSSKNFNYRNKVTFQVKEKLGFYNKNSYEIVRVDECIISEKVINDAIRELNKLDLKDIKKIVCRTNRDDLMVIIETDNDKLNVDAIKECANSIYLKIKDEYKLVYGDEYIYETVGDFKYLVSPDSFFQINLDVCEKLYSKIKEFVGTGKNVLDLYCGTGSISIFVSENNNVLGIEINKSAIRDAKKNKELNGVKNIDFICGDSGKELFGIDFNPDVVIVDPPRSGLNQDAIKNIIKLRPDNIIYVSCDPMTLARDLNYLSSDYKIESITPFDMFPNTCHVEVLSYLSRK